MTRYRFKQRHRQFSPGDLVPETFDPGVVGTLLACHKIEAVPIDERELADVKALDEPPQNKAVQRNRARRKRKSGEAA